MKIFAFITVTLMATARAENYEIVDRMDHVLVDEGDDVYFHPNLDVEACANQCSERDDCNSFTFCNHNGGFVRREKGRCYGKSKQVTGSESTKRHRRQCTSYAVGRVASQSKYGMVDSWGQVLLDEGDNVYHHGNLNVEECAEQCSGQSDCNSFTFCNHAGGFELQEKGHCWGKSKEVTGSESTKRHKRCTSYYIQMTESAVSNGECQECAEAYENAGGCKHARKGKWYRIQMPKECSLKMNDKSGMNCRKQVVDHCKAVAPGENQFVQSVLNHSTNVFAIIGFLSLMYGLKMIYQTFMVKANYESIDDVKC